MTGLHLSEFTALGALAIAMGGLVWLANRVGVRAQARLEAEEKREIAQRFATAAALRRTYQLDKTPAPPLRTTRSDTGMPWLIPPANLGEPLPRHEISTGDTPDGDARSAAQVTTLCMPADTADVPRCAGDPQ